MKPGNKSLAEFAEAQAAERLKTLLANVHQAARHPGKAGPIHDVRVSIRRFTQALRVFRDLWDHGHYRKIRRRLRKLMDLCANVRNCDIAVEVLEAAGVHVAGDLKTRLRKRRSRAASDLAEHLAHWQSRGSMQPWRDWLRVSAGKKQSVASRAHQVLRPLTRQYFKLGSHAASHQTNPDELHQLRLAAKGLRYSLEIFGAIGGAGWEQEVERIREVQDLLGAINDCVTTSGLLAESRHKAQLKHLLDQRLNTFRQRWPELYKSTNRRRNS